ncbi:MAG: acetyl-CoA C-acetyltransferase [Clostridia bacterium]
MKNIYLVEAVRTAVGSYGGSLKDIPAAKLGSIVVKEAIDRSGIDAAKVDEVIFGQVISAGCGQNVARQVVIGAGLDQTVPGMTVNKVCGSGLKTVTLAAQILKAGDGECIVAGGTENMSAAPYVLPSARWGQRMGDGAMVDTMVKDALWDVYNNYHMGVTAENLATKYELTREEQDVFAANSQNKAEAAQAAGKFADEIVPVTIKVKRQDVEFKDDEFIKKGVTAEGIAKLRPAFKKDGTVTAANASGINDGAAAVVVCTEDFVKANGLKPLAKVVAYGSVGCDPAIMGIGPVESVRQALSRANMTIDDIDLVEANEAFAAQSLSVAKELNFNMDKVNVNGGAIAIGHPVGASGARILTTLLHEMKRSDAKTGLATLCIGGGMGEALIVERDELCK